jgi:hypothetical protein
MESFFENGDETLSYKTRVTLDQVAIYQNFNEDSVVNSLPLIIIL